MASDLLSYWKDQLEAASTIEDIAKCQKFIALYSGDKALYERIKANSPVVYTRRPYTFGELLYLPIYLGTLVLHSMVLIFSWIVFAVVLYFFVVLFGHSLGVPDAWLGIVSSPT